MDGRMDGNMNGQMNTEALIIGFKSGKPAYSFMLIVQCSLMHVDSELSSTWFHGAYSQVNLQSIATLA